MSQILRSQPAAGNQMVAGTRYAARPFALLLSRRMKALAVWIVLFATSIAPVAAQSQYAARSAALPPAALPPAALQPTAPARSAFSPLEHNLDKLNRIISVRLAQVKLGDALQVVAAKADLQLATAAWEVLSEHTVTLDVANVPALEVFHELIRGTDLRLKVSPTGHLIVTKTQGAPSRVLHEPAALRTGEIAGTVTDAETGQALPGATVVIDGTTQGSSTDANGDFRITSVEPGTYDLRASFIGYSEQVVEDVLVVDGEVTRVNFELSVAAVGLDDVVVVGYGTQRAANVTGAVSAVSAQDLGDAPVGQVAQSLQGKMAGVRINQTTGRPGEGMTIQVRGAASLTAGATPLYVVDGMPIEGDISHLNPAEIESISILKDAASASLYGSRAANGVVLVQTRSAAPGETRVEFNSYLGIEHVPQARRLEMMNAREYAQFQKEIDELNGRPVDPEFQSPDAYGEGTDWFEEVTTTAPVQSYNLSISTGSDAFSTVVMGGYFNQHGVVMGTGYERVSLRANTSFEPSERLTLGFNVAPSYATNTNFATDGNPYGSGNIISSALITTPLADPYNEDGTLAMTATDPATFANPNWVRVAKDLDYAEEELKLFSNASAALELTDGLTVQTSANVQLENQKTSVFEPSTIGTLFSGPPTIPSGSEAAYTSYNWVNENLLTYQTQWGSHNVDALAGLTFQQFRSELNSINGQRFPDDKIRVVSAAGQVSVASNVGEWSLMSYLARVNYDYEGKYLLTGSFRRDGSSRFGPENRWGNFFSGSIGWIVSEEPFWTIDPISFFKVRASYGTTGNFQIGNYSYTPTLSAVYYPFGTTVGAFRAADNLGDRGLGWEKNKAFNLGADIYLFNDRLQVEYNYYRRRTSDLLFDVDVPVSSGFSSIQTNIGELAFWGHEISVRSSNVVTRDFFWDTSFNISFDRNEVVSLSSREGVLFHGATLYSFSSHISRVGEPMAQFWGAVQDGVYDNQEEFDNSPKHTSSQVGTIKFRDLNGDGEITFPEDYTVIGNPWPDFTFGMTNRVDYKAFDLSLTLTGSVGNDILAHHENWTTNLDGVFNVLREVKDRWKSPEDPGAGQYGSTQQGTTFLERDRWHTRFIKPGSYLSFKNITLGYQLPISNLDVVDRMRVYASIQNAFIITKYSGPNPEVNTRQDPSGSMPGFDENSYPVPRTISIGLSVGF